LLDAAGADAERPRHRVVDDLREPRGFRLELGLREVPEDRPHDVLHGPARGPVLECGDLARLAVRRLGGKEVGLDAVGHGLGVRETYFLSSEATDSEARQVAALENGSRSRRRRSWTRGARSR